MEIEKLSSKFVNKHKVWIKTIVAKSMRIYPQNPRWDAEELESVAWVGFVEAWKAYDKNFGVPFKAFARRQIVNQILKFVSENMFTLKCRYDNIKDKQDILDKVHNEQISMKTVGIPARSNNTIENVEVDPPSTYYSQTDIENKEVRQKIREELQKLPVLERKVLKLRYVDELTLTQIGKRINRSHECVRLIINKAQAKIKERIKDKEWLT